MSDEVILLRPEASGTISTRHQFETALDTLRDDLLRMGRDVDAMLQNAERALDDRDADGAAGVLEADDAIDRTDLQIEADCIRLLATQQPMARDLRLIGTALKVITDLERIGDHAVDIAKIARKLSVLPRLQPPSELGRLAALARTMLEDSLAAFLSHDLALVTRVCEADDKADELYRVVRDDLHDVMRNSPDLVVQASYLLFVAHYFERVADHAVNIAERVQYVETGRLGHVV